MDGRRPRRREARGDRTRPTGRLIHLTRSDLDRSRQPSSAVSGESAGAPWATDLAWLYRAVLGSATLGAVSTPVRLFLVSPALAVRRALARALDAEAAIDVVGEASTSSEALVRVRAARPDVVLAGSRLRDPDPVEMCRLLLSDVPDLHVLIVDVDEDQKFAGRAFSAGAAGVVPDTADEPDLVDAIETAASGQMVMSTKALMRILNAENEAANDPLAHLTPLERELFELVGQGLSNGEIAGEMRLAPGTVRNYVSRLLRKLAFERRAQVVALAARRSLADTRRQGTLGQR